MLANSGNQDKQISRTQAVLGIINGMIGSIALTLPLCTFNNNQYQIYISIAISCLFCIYSSWIYLLHLGDQPDIGYILNDHFKLKVSGKLIYDISIWIFILFLCIQYQYLIYKIWSYVFFANDQQSEYYELINSLTNGVALIFIVLLLAKFKFGAKTMVYGIISLALYLIYLVYMLIQHQNSQNYQMGQQFCQGIKGILPFMTQGFMIQCFLVPFLKKLKNEQRQRGNFMKYTTLSYIIGGIVYAGIALIGHYGYRVQNENAYGILKYLQSNWMTKSIAIIYILHIYSVYPEYLLISKQIFLENVQKICTRWPDNNSNCMIIYVILFVGISIIGIKIPQRLLMILNGGLLGCFITFIIPCFLQLYCMFFIPKKRRILPQIDQQASSSTLNQQSIQNYYVECTCSHYKSTNMKILMSILLIISTSFGVYQTIQSFKVQY